MDYEVVSTDVEGFNETARKIKLEEPVKLEDYGEIQTFIAVRPRSFISGGIGIFYKEDSSLKNEVMRIRHAADDLIRESTSHNLETVEN